MKFRKRPIVVDAVQFFVDRPFPPGLCVTCLALIRTPHVHTLEGPMNVQPGDWIITGIRGEHYPCKHEIFTATYEPVEHEVDEREVAEVAEREGATPGCER